MTRKRLPGKNKKTGPKTVFTNEQLANVVLLTKLSATNEQIALFFNVTQDTINRWMRLEDFKQARTEGGLHADMRVVASLYQRAIGYEYEEVDAIRTKNGDFITKISKKQMAPDIKAQIHWLSNRQRENWASSQNMNHNHSGSIQHIHNNLEDIPVSELSKEAQGLLFEVTQKQLANGGRDN